LNDAQPDYQHCERYVIVIEPMPSSHGALPLFKPVVGFESVFTPPLFQSYFDARSLVSWFKAKIWPTFRSLWRELVHWQVAGAISSATLQFGAGNIIPHPVAVDSNGADDCLAALIHMNMFNPHEL
jgi:hypothetical protein